MIIVFLNVSVTNTKEDIRIWLGLETAFPVNEADIIGWCQYGDDIIEYDWQIDVRFVYLFAMDRSNVFVTCSV